MANQRNSRDERESDRSQSDSQDIPKAGTGSRNLARWQRLAEVRASMQHGNVASSGAILGELGLAAKDAGAEPVWSELERELMATPETVGLDVMAADKLEGDDSPVLLVTVTVIATSILETIVNANTQGAINVVSMAVVNVNGAGPSNG